MSTRSPPIAIPEPVLAPAALVARTAITLAPTVAGYLAVAVDNVSLMIELSTKRRDLELVRDSSLDFAQSKDMDEVLEAVVQRLLDALGMHACYVRDCLLGYTPVTQVVSAQVADLIAAPPACSFAVHV